MTKQKKILKISFVIFMVLLCAVLTIFVLVPFIRLLATEQGRDMIQKRVEGFGIFAPVLFVLMEITHIVLAFIPGGPVEIIGGVLFGAFWGLVLCEIGIFAATVIIYNLVKKFGKPLVDAFVPEDKFKKFKFLHDEKKLELIVFIILMIPGTPKDVISYMTSLTDINRYRFYFIATLARIPSVTSSAFMGATLGNGKPVITVIIFLITGAVGIIGIFLNNYENVNADGFRGIEKLGKNDSVYVFYTTNAGNLSFEAHKKLVESSGEIKYFSVSAGKNALDFQLTMFAGYILGKGTTQNIYIISNDKGFDANLSFYDNYLYAEGVEIVRHTSIAGTFVSKEKPSKVRIVKSDNGRADSLYNSLCDLLPAYSSCDIINISAVLLGTSDKQDFHRELVARFKQERGEEIYGALKSDFTELKKFDSTYQKLRSILPDYSPSEIIKINSVLQKSKDKNSFYRELVSKFGQSHGTEIYNLLKSEYINLKKTA